MVAHVSRRYCCGTMSVEQQNQINVCKPVKRITYPYNFIIKRNETKAIPILPEKRTSAVVRDIKIYFSLRWLMCVYGM